MPSSMSRLLSQLSRADLERLLETKAEVEALESRRADLQKELAAVEKKLTTIVGSAVAGGRRKKASKKKATKKATTKKTKKTKKAAKKKAANKKTAKKKVAKKKVARKKTAGKKTATASRKTATRKKTSKKAAGKSTARRAPRAKQPTLEDVVVGLIEKNGGPMSFQDILGAIVQGQLFATRSKQFDNVLRRTLSTSDRIKRVSRGVYGI